MSATDTPPTDRDLLDRMLANQARMIQVLDRVDLFLDRLEDALADVNLPPLPGMESLTRLGGE